MLNYNITCENITNENALALATTIKYEQFDMRIMDVKASISRLDKKIENKSGKFTVKQVEGFKEERAELEKLQKGYESTLADCKDVHDKVLDEICSVKSENGNQNRPDSVRNLFRIIASADCKLAKWAIIDSLTDRTDIFESFETVASVDSVNEDGNAVQSKALKDAYKKANESIKKLFKDILSIEVANAYTGVVRIRFNGTDLALLHKMYIQGVRNEFETNKDTGVSTFKGRKTNTLISKKVSKDGKVTPNFAKFAEKVCDLAVEKVAAK